MMRRRCFACGRVAKNPLQAVTEDLAQVVDVGTECYKQIGPTGWRPPQGGPKLYRGRFAPDGKLVSVVGLPDVKIPDYLRSFNGKT